MTVAFDARNAFGPWHPGIESQVPDAIRHLCTFLRPENARTSLPAARELCDLTGLPLADVVAFRPERLALHELLIRVTADLSVPDGSRIEDLGINFRQITRTLLDRYIEPRMDEIRACYDGVRGALAAVVEREVQALAGDAASAKARSGLLRLFARPRPDVAAPKTAGTRELDAVARWEGKAHAGGDPDEAAACRALARVVSAILVRHGQLWGSREMLARLAVDIACNQRASDAIGELIAPWFVEGARAEGFRRLPAQVHPVVMNTKGASASGKSTLRPLQRRLAGEIGVDWREFALISPDIWRKQLLDYASLGPHYKYAGAFTGEELKIVDEKLDRYMAGKAARGEMPHLLIDRFRFDSFAPDSNEAGSNLLTRFGHILYLFFMITPPASLVERAWNRGLEVGRYKAVDDTLAHGVEAYSGMPELFFTWVHRADKRVHFEFLDNSVRLPQHPRTVAFGWNDTINILDVGCLLDVERYRRVNVDATGPEALFTDPDALAPSRNTGFLRQCVDQFHEANFADQASGRVYLRLVDGRPAWADPVALARALAVPDTRAGLQSTVPAAFDAALPGNGGPLYLRDIATHAVCTLGGWGDAPEPLAVLSAPAQR
ncbi:MAG: hypothetical protein ACM3JC_16850 [Rudaea sp.]